MKTFFINGMGSFFFVVFQSLQLNVLNSKSPKNVARVSFKKKVFENILTDWWEMNFGTEFRTRKPASENIFYDLMSLKRFFVRFLRVFHSLFSHFQCTAERNIRVHRQRRIARTWL